MDSTLWKRALQLFERAVALPATEREDFLEAACEGEDELASAVRRLFEQDAREGFPEPPRREELLSAGEGAPRRSGRQIGPYRLERVIGEGGMGRVYLARRADEQFEQRVALKLIKRGMDTDDILRRFKNERQVLADLQHPGIARLLDGGATADGRPYLVMEYVIGEPIDRWCDRNALPIAERLALFVEACEAVQHAHEHRVVHRDLKPSNILVTTEGETKLLDFGIAKVLDVTGSARTADVTATELRLMTPEYAAPEQVRGGRITPATDVYSLGVILYELLTGHRPYLMSTHLRGDLERVICEEDPERPSVIVRRPAPGVAPVDELSSRRGSTSRHLRARLAGDLDTIALKALRKEPERRYATARELAEDIRRSLEGRPVFARPDTWRYRTAKFARRNRALVASGLAIFLVLLAGLAGTTWMYLSAERQRAETERREYVAEISAAALALQSLDVADARQHLERAPQRLRGWEWRHLASRLDRSERTFVHAERSSPTFPFQAVRAVDASLDGRWLASGAQDRCAALWDLARGSEVRRWEHPEFVVDLGFSPDGELLAVAPEGGQAHLWNVATGELARAWDAHEGGVACVRFDPRGARLATGGFDDVVRTWDPSSGEELSSLEGHASPVNELAFNGDGSLLASGSIDGEARLWRLDVDGESPVVLIHTGTVVQLAFDPRGERLATLVIDGTAHVWDVETGRLLQAFPAQRRAGRGGIGFTPGGERLVTASNDRSIRTWRWETGANLANLLGHVDGIECLRLLPDGSLFTGSADGTIKAWDIGAEDVRTLGREGGECIAVAPSGAVVARIGDDSIDLWEVAANDPVWRSDIEWRSWSGLAFSPDGKRVASGGPEGVRFWNAASGEPLAPLVDPDGPVAFTAPAFSPDGSTFAGGGRDALVRLWNHRTGELLARLEGGDERILAMEFDHGGDGLLAGSADHRAYVWDVRSRSVTHTLEGHEAGVVSVAFARDGSRLATGSWDSTARLWDPSDGRELAVLAGHTGRVHSVDFSPDGRLLATGSDDSTIKLWDVQSASEVLTLHGHEFPVIAVEFSADGARLVSICKDKTRIWEAPEPAPEPAR